jgi:hypothetical protein
LKQHEGFVTPATDQQTAAEASLGVDAVKAHRGSCAGASI